MEKKKRTITIKSKKDDKLEKEIEVVLIVLLVATVAMVFFIFSRSLSHAEESAQQSGVALGYLNSLLKKFNLDIQATELFVRKTAHFIEFCAFGTLLSLTLSKLMHSMKRAAFPSLFFGLLVPVLDESIQYFSPGRSPEVKDVMLDFAGCVAGIILVSIIRKIVLSHR